MTPIQSDNAALIAAFFSPPNQLSFPDANAESCVDVATPTILRFQKADLEWPLLLPCSRLGSDLLAWYICAHSEAHLRALIDEMRAFIGPSHSHFSEARAELDINDPLEKSLADRFQGRVLRIDVPLIRQSTVLKLIGHYINLLHQRPRASLHVPVSFGRLRAKFDSALLAGNEAAAQEYLAALRARHLSAENLHFLAIRFHAALGQWDRIVEHELLDSLLNLRLPPETYSDIFEAIYRMSLQSFEQSGDLDKLLHAFDERLFQRFPSLFRTRRQSRRPVVLKGFICRELSLPMPDPAACMALLAHLPVDAFPAAIRQEIERRCKLLQAPDPVEAAKEAIAAEEFDRAYELYRALPVSLDALCALLRCAREIGEPTIAIEVLELLNAASESLRESAIQKSPRMFKMVSEMAVSTPADVSADALPLLRQLNWLQELGESAEAYLDRFRKGVTEWDPSELLADIGAGQKAADMLESLALGAPEVFEQVYPLWYRLFIERVPVPDTRLIPVYQALISTLDVRGLFGEDELTLIKRAMSCILECGVSPTTYQAMVDELTSLLNNQRALRLLDWALEVADQLTMATCPAPEARIRFLNATIGLGRQYANRLSQLQFNLLYQLGEEAGLDIGFDRPAEPESVEVVPITCRVAIYSLDTAIASRAKEILKRTYPNMRIDVNHDQVCTEQLRSLAKHVDWFVFAWRCATHQAWYCVRGAMPDSSRLCWAQGNGSASLAQAVESKLRNAD